MDPSLKQEDFIYDLNWGQKIDDFFINYLCFEARVGNFVWPNKIYRTLWQAIDMVNHHHNQEFSYTYGLKKLDLLEERFNTFSWMLSLERVVHDPELNFVYAPEDVWKIILKKKPFAYAYLAVGTAKYEELYVIFAPAVGAVIVVSSDDETVVETSGYSWETSGYSWMTMWEISGLNLMHSASHYKWWMKKWFLFLSRALCILCHAK